MTDKIAFLFLTRGEHNNVNLWEKFFETADPKKYKIIIHPKDISFLTSSLWNHPNSTIIRPIPTAWGSITLVKATLYLMQMAYADLSVKKFILLSESCIPTNNFQSIYDNSISQIGLSRINWTFGKNIDRYNIIKSYLPNTITPHNWIKQSQWMCLDRKHVSLLFQPNLQSRFGQFLQHFQYCPVPDEHFFINYFIHILKLHPNEFINHPITFVDWNSNSKHPKLFAYLPTEIIRFCRDNKIFFARKFAPLQLSLDDINSILDIKPNTEKIIEENIKPISNSIEINKNTKIENKLSPKQEPKFTPKPEPKLEIKPEPEPEPEPEIILSLEEQSIVEYFNVGSLKELKQKVVKLTQKQIISIYSTLFNKPPNLIESDSEQESESDSDSDNSEEIKIIHLDVIAEEPSDIENEDGSDEAEEKSIGFPICEPKTESSNEEEIVESNELNLIDESKEQELVNLNNKDNVVDENNTEEAVIEASKPDLINESNEEKLVIESNEEELVIDSNEEELVIESSKQELEELVIESKKEESESENFNNENKTEIINQLSIEHLEELKEKDIKKLTPSKQEIKNNNKKKK